MNLNTELSPYKNQGLLKPSPMNWLPAEIILTILFQLELEDRLAMGLTCKLLHRLADSNSLWKKECLTYNVPISPTQPTGTGDINYKSLFLACTTTDPSKTYYTVGQKIKVSRRSSREDGPYPYPSKRTQIPDNEIGRSFISSGYIKVFNTFEQALLYGKSIQKIDDWGLNLAPAVFSIKVGRQWCNEQTINIKRTPPRLRFFDAPPSDIRRVSFFEINVSKVKKITEAVMSHDSQFAVKYGKEEETGKGFKLSRM